MPSSSRSKLFSLVVGITIVGCAGPGDINRTQPDKIDKAIFFNPDGTGRAFYYRKTTVGVPPTSSYTFEGMMGQLLKVRFTFEGQNGDYLVGYRSFDYAPGSENAFTGGANNTDTPFLKFAVKSHFDVKREYNPATGEQTNVISENTTDRPWNERQFMRVDWSQNLAEQSPDTQAVDPLNPYLSAGLSNPVAVGEADQPLVNPDRPIFTHDYVDFTTKETRTPDYNACLTLFDPYFDDTSAVNCGPAEITSRNSLLPVPPTTQYEPLSYPDNQTLLADDGTPLRVAFTANGVIPCTTDALAAAGLTGDDCSDANLPQFAKFGYFRTAVPTYDPKVGATQQGRQYLINRWNLWQTAAHVDASGNPMVISNGSVDSPDRATRTITYYLNVAFPDDQPLRDAATQVMADWNQAMKETVAALKLTATHGQSASMAAIHSMAQTLPDILVLQPNGCSVDNVNAFVQANQDVRQLVENQVPKDVLDLGAVTTTNLLQACSALSAVTETRPDGDPKQPKFVWQRDGDLRYSFIHWVDRPQVAGPLGFGPSSTDPETGEIISASAFIYGANLNTYAQFATDSVQLANGTLSVDDLLSGKNISDVLAESSQTTRARLAQPVTTGGLGLAVARVNALGPTPSQRLVKVGAGIDDQGLLGIKGTTLEKLLFNDDILPAIIPGYVPGGTPPDNLFDLAMSKPWLSSQARDTSRQRFQTLAQNGCVYLAEFADDAILGTALELNRQGLNADQMYSQLRASIFRGVTDHEVGHTMGLRHNFSSSTDALNYPDQFWQIRQMPQDQWEANGLSEYEYASVMDYGSRFNSDVHGLGRYDTAAIRFGYGQLIDLISNANESAYTGLNYDIFYSDYSKLPAEVGGMNNMSDAGTAATPYKSFIDLWTNDFKNVATNGGSIHVLPERPYKFCSDEFVGSLDCKPWDKGANQREIVANVTELYRDYYVFNAFRRGRETWQVNNYLERLADRYFGRYIEAFQFFFFYGGQIPQNSDLLSDLFGASADSLNALGTILQTPDVGAHCSLPAAPNLLVQPINNQGFVDTTLCPTAAPQVTLAIPDAKPFFPAFSSDYYYQITHTGSIYEKLLALEVLTDTEARFFKIDTFADSNRYSVNFYRIFRDQMISLLSGVIRDDPSSYAGYLDSESTFQPRPVVDLTTYGIVNPPVPPYAQPGAMFVDTQVNKSIRYWALLLALSRLGTSWDATLDFQNFLAVAVKGADDDFTVAASVPVKEFTHPTTGVIYRAPDNTTPTNIGAEILDELTQITGVAGTPGTIPTRFGTYTDGTAVPDWQTAKAAVDAAAASGDQTAYTNALNTFTSVDQLLAYRIDLIGDIRLFRKQLFLLNGVSP
jgi:hypothetical protein